MSSIVTDQGIVHYETYGQGPPVILLHGWLGSWSYWLDTMEALGHNYRLYALDFWGFGDSGKRRESYLIDDFVELVDQFMSRLGIVQAPVVGHSMGGTVALSLALNQPQRVCKVAVVGSPVPSLYHGEGDGNGWQSGFVRSRGRAAIGHRTAGRPIMRPRGRGRKGRDEQRDEG